MIPQWKIFENVSVIAYTGLGLFKFLSLPYCILKSVLLFGVIKMANHVRVFLLVSYCPSFLTSFKNVHYGGFLMHTSLEYMCVKINTVTVSQKGSPYQTFAFALMPNDSLYLYKKLMALASPPTD